MKRILVTNDDGVWSQGLHELARAVARLGKFFGMAWHLAHSETKWVLPKGESAKSELDEAKQTWQGGFRLVPSLTHPASAIVIAEHVQRKGKR